MQAVDGQFITSPTNLVRLLGCRHLALLDLQAVASGRMQAPVKMAQLDLLRTKGLEDEQRYLARLRAEGRPVTEIAKSSPQAMVAATLEAMALGRSAYGPIPRCDVLVHLDDNWLCATPTRSVAEYPA